MLKIPGLPQDQLGGGSKPWVSQRKIHCTDSTGSTVHKVKEQQALGLKPNTVQRKKRLMKKMLEQHESVIRFINIKHEVCINNIEKS